MKQSAITHIKATNNEEVNTDAEQQPIQQQPAGAASQPSSGPTEV
jgi:hypothetical protein